MERLVPVDAVSRPPWSAAAASVALHGGIVIALIAVSIPPRPPDITSRAIDVIIISEAPRPGNVTDKAGNGDITDVASPTPFSRRSNTKQAAPPKATPRLKIQESHAHAKPPVSRFKKRAKRLKRPSPQAKFHPQQSPESPRKKIKRTPLTFAAIFNKTIRHVTGAGTPARRGSSPSGHRIGATFLPGSAKNPIPRYPRFARIRGWEGRVVLLVSVNQKGNPGVVRVETSSGFSSLDKAAVRAVKRWRFQPARLDGTPIADTVRVPIRFRLAKG